MNAFNVNNPLNRNTRRMEIAFYYVLAICLIGHVFYIDGPLSMLNFALLACGVVATMLAVTAWTPLADRFTDVKPLKLAKVFSIGNNHNPNQPQDKSDRHAA